MTKQLKQKKIAVLYGGLSSEREISLQSGKAVIDALENLGASVEPVDVDEKIVEVLPTLQSEKVFIALHGGAGEDGTIQAVLDLTGKPYTGSGVQASAIAMNKLFTKQIWLAEGLPTPAYVRLDELSKWELICQQLGEKVIVKPACEGSSIGMQVADSDSSLKAAFDDAINYDSHVFAEQWVDGEEFTVGVLAGEPLPVIKLETDNLFYDFDAKYRSNDTRYICPCGLSVDQEKDMQALALQAFDAIGCKGWGRVDVMRNSEGENFLLEVNTVPGLTSHSLVPMAAKAAGKDFEQLMIEILAA